MKKILLSAFVAAALLSSCVEGGDDLGTAAGSDDILRLGSAQISTRVIGDEWEAQDAIGVTMFIHNSNTFHGVANSEYRASTGGKSVEFKAHTGVEPLRYYSDGTVDLFAISPYFEDMNNGAAHTFDFTDQSNLKDLDFMFASVFNLSKSGDAVELEFQRAFSKVAVELVAGEGFLNSDLEGASVEMLNMVASSVSTIDFNTPSNERATVVMNSDNTPTFEAIIYPETTLPEFKVAVAGYTYPLSPNEEIEFAFGTSYTFEITVNRTTLGELSCTIKARTEVDKGDLSAVTTWTLDDISEGIMPEGDTWTIYGEADDAAQFSGLRAALNAKFDSGDGTTTSLIFPDLKSVPDQAFYDYDAIAGIYMSKATEIGEGAFYDCYTLESVNLPAATSIGEYAFAICGKLETINIGYDEQGDHATVTNINPKWLDNISAEQIKMIDLSIGKIADTANIEVDATANTLTLNGSTIFTFNSITAAE